MFYLFSFIRNAAINKCQAALALQLPALKRGAAALREEGIGINRKLLLKVKYRNIGCLALLQASAQIELLHRCQPNCKNRFVAFILSQPYKKQKAFSGFLFRFDTAFAAMFFVFHYKLPEITRENSPSD